MAPIPVNIIVTVTLYMDIFPMAFVVEAHTQAYFKIILKHVGMYLRLVIHAQRMVRGMTHYIAEVVVAIRHVQGLRHAVIPQIMEMGGHHALICVVLVVVTIIVFLDRISIVVVTH
jgi:hypothetical protein